MILKSMTDFVLEQRWLKSGTPNVDVYDRMKAFDISVKYALFLKQPLTLGMFTPVGEDGDAIVLPRGYYSKISQGSDCEECKTYQKAKEKVLFEGFEIRTEKNKQFIGIEGYEIKLPLEKFKMTIENLANDWEYIQLTELAEKQFK